MTKELVVTVDTSRLTPRELNPLMEAARHFPCMFRHVSVSDREFQGTTFTPPTKQALESGVYGESRYGEARYGAPERFKVILKVISNGSFHGKGGWDNLTKNQRHQFQDAMILEAHARDGGDIFVSDDTKAFGKANGVLRQRLEEVCSTRIMTGDEFIAYCATVAPSQGN